MTTRRMRIRWRRSRAPCRRMHVYYLSQRQGHRVMVHLVDETVSLDLAGQPLKRK